MSIDIHHTSLSQVAAVNQSITKGDVAQTADLAGIVNGLRPVAAKLPAWWQLSYVAALVAQRAGDASTAIVFYQSVKDRASMRDQPAELVNLVKSGEIDLALKSLSKASQSRFSEDTSTEALRARPPD